MAKITWLGDSETVIEPPSILWNGIKFPVNVAVEVADAHMIRKARGNQYFFVEEAKSREIETQGEKQDKGETETQEFSFRKAANKSGYVSVKAKKQKSKAKKQKADAADAADTAPAGADADPRSSEDARCPPLGHATTSSTRR